MIKLHAKSAVHVYNKWEWE